ncbi:MAG TPA: hypothetical protein VMR14_21605 [Streptosporangiaceae bacterium]|jgi:hypothetical protein|nr:hypothetical protein [Streptosporangiaceae bacterium]
MSDRVSRTSGWHAGPHGESVLLGVLWSPPSRRRRRFVLRILLPGSRRGTGLRRRGRYGGQHAAPGGTAFIAVGIPGLAAGCP